MKTEWIKTAIDRLEGCIQWTGDEVKRENMRTAVYEARRELAALEDQLALSSEKLDGSAA